MTARTDVDHPDVDHPGVDHPGVDHPDVELVETLSGVSTGSTTGRRDR